MMSRKNKIRMAISSLLVLVLAVTCVAVYQSGSKSNANEKEFAKIEEGTPDEVVNDSEEEAEDVNTSEVEGTREIEEAPEMMPEAEPEVSETEEAPQEEEVSSEAVQAPEVIVPEVNFTESSLMQWPVNGQVIVDYNMENTIYFETLNEYKYSPAIAIAAEVNTPVTAATNGKVVSIINNEETGTTVTLDMGNGYQAVYGQLKEVGYEPEQYVEAGAVLGYVSEPTKYYTKEGANVYFALSKDGQSLDPIEYLP